MLKLDPITHDLVIENFSYAFLKNDMEDLNQRLKVKLLTNRGEWFFDRTYGIPYFDEVFVKGVKKDQLDDIFKIAISQERNVDSIVSYSSVLNLSQRTFSIEAKVKKKGGEIIPISLSF